MKFVKLTNRDGAVWVNMDLVVKFRASRDETILLVTGMATETEIRVLEPPAHIVQLLGAPTAE